MRGWRCVGGGASDCGQWERWDRKGDGQAALRQVDSDTFLSSRFTAAQGPETGPELQPNYSHLQNSCRRRLAAGAGLSAGCCLLTNGSV